METNLHLINLTTYAGSEDLIESVQGYYQEIGVKANLVILDAASRNAQARAHEFDNHIGLVSTSSDLLLAGRVYMTSRHPTVGNYQDPPSTMPTPQQPPLSTRSCRTKPCEPWAT